MTVGTHRRARVSISTLMIAWHVASVAQAAIAGGVVEVVVAVIVAEAVRAIDQRECTCSVCICFGRY